MAEIHEEFGGLAPVQEVFLSVMYNVFVYDMGSMDYGIGK